MMAYIKGRKLVDRKAYRRKEKNVGEWCRERRRLADRME